MISLTIDATAKLNSDNTYQLEIGGWENIIIQTVGPTGTFLLQGSNDGGAQTGTIEDGPQTATNFTTIVATNMLDGTLTSSLATAGLYKVTQPCRYLKFGGASAAATKVLIFLSKVI